MTTELTDLARRAVACKGWRWMPGMLTDDGTTVCSQSDDGYLLIAGSEGSCVSWWPIGGHLPDLTDPATLGCLLALVRGAWGDPRIHAAPALYPHDAPPEYRYTISHWHVYSPGPYDSTKERKCDVVGKTEAEALVAALEKA